jgi:uracil-DNA glycosylase family 4
MRQPSQRPNASPRCRWDRIDPLVNSLTWPRWAEESGHTGAFPALDGLAHSISDWWAQAGVDTFVDETPRDWLAAVRPAPSVEASSAAVVAAPVPPPRAALPADLGDFRAWLLADPSIPGRPAARLDAQGDAANGIMILVDMPETEDRAAGRLLSGAAGALLDRMLVAMGLSRDAIYLASFSPARPASGMLDPAAIAQLLVPLRHHLALAAPKKLLLMGEAPAQALLGLGSQAARGRAHAIDLADRSLPVIATFPPRFIVQATEADLKDRRTRVWEDLQLFMKL